jgi:energy-coupling factor transport system permease protein
MIGDITIGQYFPGNSLLHKMDARMKIVLTLLLMISIFLCRNYLSLGLVIASAIIVTLISKINIKVILKGIKPILVIVILTTILNLFYGSGDPIWQLGFLKITINGINSAIFMALRIIILVIFGLMLTYTTTPTSLTDAIESLLKPLERLHIDVHSIAMTMTIALRFIPTLVEEVEKIMSAQKSRGADMETGGILKRVKAIIPVMIPLFISSFRRANELAYAMECRCYRGGNGRTKMKQMHMSTRDYISLVVVSILFVSIILIKIFMSNVV